jgi:serine/threonine protein kinase
MECDLWEATAKGVSALQLRRWTAQIVSYLFVSFTLLILTMCYQALGLDALHNMGIMHRDLKPENILLSRAGDVRIADLGAAYVHDASRLTRGQSYARDAVFTPGYAAPELVGSGLRDDGAWIAPGARCPRYGLEVDWWALGCIMYMMMAGSMLFAEKTDLLEYAERYKAHRGRAWLRSRCSMSENETRVVYGVSFFFFLPTDSCDGLNRCHLRYSCSMYRLAGVLPLKSSRESRSSRTKSECFLKVRF